MLRLFIEMAILIAIPMLTTIYTPPGRGVVRFLIYQTLAMPFILVAGWLLAGVEASPGDLALTAQSAAMLGMGFAFLLAIFPLYNWIPLLLEESSPYIVGFLLWIVPTVTIIFGAGFLDRYSWLRSSPQLILALRYVGLLMVVSGGAFAAFQRHLGRIMAYGSIAETGFSLLALSLDFRLGIPILFLLIPARALGLAVWSLSLTVIKENVETMRFGAAPRNFTHHAAGRGRNDRCHTFDELRFPCWLASLRGWHSGKVCPIFRSVLRYGWQSVLSAC